MMSDRSVELAKMSRVSSCTWRYMDKRRNSRVRCRDLCMRSAAVNTDASRTLLPLNIYFGICEEELVDHRQKLKRKDPGKY